MPFSTKTYIFSDNSFDVISLIAAVWVMLAHTLNYSGVLGNVPDFVGRSLLNPGQAVTIMFFVSGYLCFPSLDRSSVLLSFYKKRFWRVIPAFVFVNVGFALLWVVVGQVGLSDITNYLLRTAKSLVSLDAGWTPEGALNNGSLWTIPVQIQFYLLTPCLAFFLRKSELHKSILIVIIGLVLYFLFEPISAKNLFLSKLCFPYLYTYIFGMFCFEYRDRIIPIVVHWLPAMLLCYMVMCWLFGFQVPLITNHLLMLSTLGTAYAFGKKRIRNEISYEIYLWHMPVFSVVSYMNKSIGCSHLLFVYLLTALISYMCFKYLETPLRTLENRKRYV